MDEQILKSNENLELRVEQHMNEEQQENIQQQQQQNEQVPFLTVEKDGIKHVFKRDVSKEFLPEDGFKGQELSFGTGQFSNLMSRSWKLETLFKSWDSYLERRRGMTLEERQVMLRSIISWGRKWYWRSWSPFQQSRENNKAVSQVIDDAKKEFDHISNHYKVTQVAIDAAGWVGSAAKAIGKGLWTVAGFLPIPGRTEYMAASGSNTMGTYGGEGHYMEKEEYEKKMQQMRKNYDITKSYSENRQRALGNKNYQFDNNKILESAYDGSKASFRDVTYKTTGQHWLSDVANKVMGLTAGFVGRNIFNTAAGVLATGWNLATVPVFTVGYTFTKVFHSLFTWSNQFSKRGFSRAINYATVSVPVPHSPAYWIKYYSENVPSAMEVFKERGLLEGIRAAIHFNVYRPLYDLIADKERDHNYLDEKSPAGIFRPNSSELAKGASHLFGGGMATAWGPLTNLFKRMKNIGKFLTFQGIGSGILDPSKQEIMDRAAKDTEETLEGAPKSIEEQDELEGETKDLDLFNNDEEQDSEENNS